MKYYIVEIEDLGLLAYTDKRAAEEAVSGSGRRVVAVVTHRPTDILWLLHSASLAVTIAGMGIAILLPQMDILGFLMAGLGLNGCAALSLFWLE